MSYEYLSAGPPARPPGVGRRRLWPWLLAGLAVLLAGLVVAGLAADWVARNLEMRSLLSAVESSEQAMSDTQASVRAALAPYEGREDLGDADQQELRAGLSAAAAAGASAVTEAGAGVEAVRILPWHASIREARDAYLDHNRAWQTYLTAATDDPAEFVTPQPEVNQTFADAEPVLRAAVPVPALFDLAARVDAVFADLADEPATEGDRQQVGLSGAVRP